MIIATGNQSDHSSSGQNARNLMVLKQVDLIPKKPDEVFPFCRQCQCQCQCQKINRQIILFKFKDEAAEEALGERGGSAVQGSIYSLAQRG